MGETHHRWTGLLLLLVLILFVLMAIFFIIAQTRVQNITEYKQGNTKLKSARNYLIWAYILAFVGAAMMLLLSILYFGHIAWNIGSEVPHLIIFIVTFITIAIAGIFGFAALSNISNASTVNKNGSEGWIWGALGVGLAGLIILVISGAWRIQYKTSQKTLKREDSLTVQTSSSNPPSYPPPDLTTQTPHYEMHNLAEEEPGAITSTYVPPRIVTRTVPPNMSTHTEVIGSNATNMSEMPMGEEYASV